MNYNVSLEAFPNFSSGKLSFGGTGKVEITQPVGSTACLWLNAKLIFS